MEVCQERAGKVEIHNIFLSGKAEIQKAFFLERLKYNNIFLSEKAEIHIIFLSGKAEIHNIFLLERLRYHT